MQAQLIRRGSWRSRVQVSPVGLFADRRLNMEGNMIVDAGATALGRALAVHSELLPLRVCLRSHAQLVLCHCPHSRSTCQQHRCVVRSAGDGCDLVLPHWQELHVAQNGISSDGVSALVDGMLAQNTLHQASSGRETSVLSLHL